MAPANIERIILHSSMSSFVILRHINKNYGVATLLKNMNYLRKSSLVWLEEKSVHVGHLHLVIVKQNQFSNTTSELDKFVVTYILKYFFTKGNVKSAISTSMQWLNINDIPICFIDKAQSMFIKQLDHLVPTFLPSFPFWLRSRFLSTSL